MHATLPTSEFSGGLPSPEGLAEARLRLIFDEMDTITASGATGVAVAWGSIGGVPAVAYATDPQRQAGALGQAGSSRIAGAIEKAAEAGRAVVGVWQCAGARIQEGSQALDGIGRVFSAIVAASGQVPQISVVTGPAAGGAVYGAALTDLVVMTEDARAFVTGPDVVRTVTGADVTAQQLGGAAVHAENGVAHVVVPDLARAGELVRDALQLLCRRRPAVTDLPAVDPHLARLVPTNPRLAYSVHDVMHRLLDPDERVVELQSRWAPNMVTALGRLAGHSVGVVANNPIRLCGCLDSASAEKAARFVRWCDVTGLPLIVLVDVPGYLPGVEQEWQGVLRRGAKLLHAFADCRVPRFTVILRKAYGGAYVAMNSRALGATHVLAWPGACVDVMGPDAAVDLVHRKDLLAAPRQDRDRIRNELLGQQRATSHADAVAARGQIDEVISPAQTRPRLAALLSAHPAEPRSDLRNIPL
jgi:acetyl-CoA/propionyl-CoA carboxylase carboxyl transferase subunit